MTKNGANEVVDLRSGPFVSYAREDQPFVRKLHEALALERMASGWQ